MLNDRLERYLYDKGLLNLEQLALVSELRTRTGGACVTVLLDENLMPFADIAAVLHEYAMIETCDLAGLALNADTAKALGHFYAERFCCVPVRLQDHRLWVAMRDPLCQRTMTALRDATGLFVEPLFAREGEIRYAINAVYASERIQTIASRFVVEESLRVNRYTLDAALLAQLENAPAVRLIDSLIESAVTYHASDIHIEPYELRLRARYRVNGRLTTYQDVDNALLPYIISRLKVMGGMDIAEKRLPQDGHFSMTVGGAEVDFRLSTLPTLFGEKAVIRLLYGRAARLRKDDLGFYPEDLAPLTALFNSAYGAVFMTGPTGSGKSTTLNCFLEELNTDAVNIVTVEDPVENPLPGVNHMNVEPAAGLNFANALRHILRQDPDIIMIGEIRDTETARIAIQAAITGHLVLSTLHTNDAAGVLERLVDMGIEPYLAAAALNGVISQRLVRRICPQCKTSTQLTTEEALLLGIPEDTPVYAGVGCGYCGHTGFQGRFAVYEYIIMNESLRRRMSADAAGFAAELRRERAGLQRAHAELQRERAELRRERAGSGDEHPWQQQHEQDVGHGQHTGLWANALRGLREGRTTAGEIIRVLRRDMPMGGGA